MKTTRAPRVLFAVAVLGVAAIPLLAASAATARAASIIDHVGDGHGPGDGDGVDDTKESLPRSFTGELSAGEQKSLLENTRCGTRQCGGPAPMKVTGSVTVCGQVESVHVDSVGRSGSRSALCTVQREEGKSCSTATCKGDLQAGKSLQVVCSDGAGAGEGEATGCRYDIKVE